jgi:hypothetical protein
VDLDAQIAGEGEDSPLDHNWQVVDHAHARWAVGTAITALDLCAAALGRLLAGYPKPSGHELDLRRAQGLAQIHSHLSAGPWVMGVAADAGYDMVLNARHALTHRRMTQTIARAFGGSSGNGRSRTYLNVPSHGMPITVHVPDLILTARDTAFRHVDAFAAMANAGSIP